MVGGIGSFTTNARVLTPGSMYPYAPILFDYIRRTMPMDRPLTLTSNEVYALSAYILNLNGLVPANAVMDAKTLPAVQMPNRSGFIRDDRPDAKAVRCMTNCRSPFFWPDDGVSLGNRRAAEPSRGGGAYRSRN
jgi:cytochrome c